jgi:hypothetical protein
MSKLSMSSISRTLFTGARGAICGAISALIALTPISYATESTTKNTTSVGAQSSRPRQAQPEDPIRAAQLALKDRPKPSVFIERMSAFLRADEVSFLKARAEEIKDQTMPELRSMGSEVSAFVWSMLLKVNLKSTPSAWSLDGHCRWKFAGKS